MKYLFTLVTIVSLFSGFVPHAAQAAAGPGDLIMSEDFPTVYVFGEDGKRHPFPNEATFFSWYDSFDDIKVISAEDLATLPLGDTVVVQPGTSLLKLPSDPTVYVVEPGGELRALMSEDQAKALFGEDWAQRVVDLPEGFFPDYERGVELDDGEIPQGIVLKTNEDELFRIDELGSAEQIDSLLTEAEAAKLEDFALDFEDVEVELEVEIEKISSDELTDVEIEHLREGLQTVDVATEDEDHDIAEIELEHTDLDEASDEIQESEDELTDAEDVLAELELEGIDTTDRQALIDQATALLAEAQAALAAGDADAADDLAKQAGELLHDASQSEDSGSDNSDDAADDSGSSDDSSDESSGSDNDATDSNSGSSSGNSGSDDNSGSGSRSGSSDSGSSGGDSSGSGESGGGGGDD